MRDVAERVDVGAGVPAHREELVRTRAAVGADEVAVPADQPHAERRVVGARRRRCLERSGEVVDARIGEELAQPAGERAHAVAAVGGPALTAAGG